MRRVVVLFMILVWSIGFDFTGNAQVQQKNQLGSFCTVKEYNSRTGVLICKDSTYHPFFVGDFKRDYKRGDSLYVKYVQKDGINYWQQIGKEVKIKK